MMTWTRRELAKAHRPQFSAERLHRDRDAELFEDPLTEIDEPPAHNTVNRWDWTFFDDLGERRQMFLSFEGRFSQPRCPSPPRRPQPEPTGGAPALSRAIALHRNQIGAELAWRISSQ
jgi:hypothetical protein